MSINLSGFPAPDLTHAGGLVQRAGGGATEVLLVRGRMPPHDWVLPKGHIEPDETPEDTARREVVEEAGVDALPLLYLGSIEFRSIRGEHVRAGYFLMRFVRDVPSLENREVLWCPAPKALQVVQFENMKALIRSAEHALHG